MTKDPYKLKAKVLTNKYGQFAKKYVDCTDDRRILVNVLNIMLEACKTMESIDNNFVCVAFNDACAERCKMLDRIVKLFEGLVYKDGRWLKEE